MCQKVKLIIFENVFLHSIARELKKILNHVDFSLPQILHYFSYFRSVWMGKNRGAVFPWWILGSILHQLIQQTAHTWGQMAVKSTKTLRRWKMIHIFAKWSFIRKSHWYMTTISVQITHTHCRGAKTQSQMLMWNECLFLKKGYSTVHSFIF